MTNANFGNMKNFKFYFGQFYFGKFLANKKITKKTRKTILKVKFNQKHREKTQLGAGQSI